jgi:hypothetical protein
MNLWIESVFQKDIGKYINPHQWLYTRATPKRIANEHQSDWLREEIPSQGNKIRITAIVGENDRCWLQYYKEHPLIA